jgi:hypothetical protein
VWTRDEEQCTFRDREGRRCPARERLEFHHLTPFAQGGDHSASNLTLRCASHDAYQADLDFGAEFMAERRTGAGHRKRKPRGSDRCGEAVRYGASAVRCEGAVWLAGPGSVVCSSPAAHIVVGPPSPAAHIVLGPPLMDNARAASGGGVARYPQRPPALRALGSGLTPTTPSGRVQAGGRPRAVGRASDAEARCGPSVRSERRGRTGVGGGELGPGRAFGRSGAVGRAVGRGTSARAAHSVGRATEAGSSGLAAGSPRLQAVVPIAARPSWARVMSSVSGRPLTPMAPMILPWWVIGMPPPQPT